MICERYRKGDYYEDIPFRDGDTFAALRNLVDTVSQEIRSLDNEYVLKASQIELENYFIDRVTIRPLILHTDQYFIENKQGGTRIDVSHDFLRAVLPGERAIVQGTRLDIAIPYEGDPMLWRIRPSAFSLGGYPQIEVKDDVIILSIQFPDDSANAKTLKSE